MGFWFTGLASAAVAAYAVIGTAHGTPAPAQSAVVRAAVVDGAAMVERAAGGLMADANARQWRFETPFGVVRAWAPGNYIAEEAVTVIVLHGYYTDVDRAWERRRLAAEFAASGVPALFIAAEAPQDSAERAPWSSLSELLNTVEGKIDVAVPRNRAVAIAFGGAGRAVNPWLRSRELNTIVLIDAAHVNTAPHYRWSRSTAHRLVEVADQSHWRSHMVGRLLPRAIVSDGLPEVGAIGTEDLYIRMANRQAPISNVVGLPALIRIACGADTKSPTVPAPE
jgi:hypothetical protein